MGWFDDQIKQRKQKDAQAFDRAFRNIAGAVTGINYRASSEEESDVEDSAINDILQHLHIPKKELPENLFSIEDKLDYALHPHGVMHRAVNLTSGWSKDAYGLMLGFKKKDNIPVVLIPFGLSSYKYYDDTSDKYRIVTKKTEAMFSQRAYAFYRPFPLKKLSLVELSKYILSVIDISDYVMMFLTTLSLTLVGLLTPRINLFLFRNVIDNGKISLLVTTAMFLLCVSWSTLIFRAARNLISTRIDTKMSICVEAATMMRVLSLPADFFKKFSSGDLAARANHVNSLCSTLVSVVLNTGLTSVFSLVYIFEIFAFAPGLVIPALSIIIITVGFSVISSLVQMRISKKQMLLSSQENGMSYAVVSGIQKVKLTGAEKRVFARWGDLYSKNAELLYNPPLFIKINGVISIAITLIGTIVIYNQAIVSHVSPAEYYAFNTAYAMVFGAFMALFSVAITAANIKPTLEMAEPILKAEPEISGNKENLARLSGMIEIVNLTFKYTENSPIIIDNLSLKINPGQYVAIVGKTGCGKSTLVRLLIGFEKPTKGNIFYDGKDLSTVDLKSLRKHIGVVTQNGKLFSGDIYSNIVISAPQLTLDEAWEAAKIAGIDEDIRRMPMGMNTLISEGSGGISGGQRQRLMIARAVAPKPKILIFDEATSALDNITQKKVSNALDRMNCTRIVIAHRLSTIKQCDRILVFDGGHIVEDGTYDELIAQNGYFADLVSRQRLDK
ncbi:MAG: ATP-binding cassette domain-containing protein [Oribacterium sp.]|nr:ATP-binding cassette domain-containing protein [Oribacterium sp.]